jgi:hypothetical protein
MWRQRIELVKPGVVGGPTQQIRHHTLATLFDYSSYNVKL